MDERWSGMHKLKKKLLSDLYSWWYKFKSHQKWTDQFCDNDTDTC